MCSHFNLCVKKVCTKMIVAQRIKCWTAAAEMYKKQHLRYFPFSNQRLSQKASFTKALFNKQTTYSHSVPGEQQKEC